MEQDIVWGVGQPNNYANEQNCAVLDSDLGRGCVRVMEIKTSADAELPASHIVYRWGAALETLSYLPPLAPHHAVYMGKWEKEEAGIAQYRQVPQISAV